ncbi:hypothetical protein [Neisseria weaveri]|uniref:hypothetical protein n=1 Tax=Neisseria weaveri TaxID=28091 RepID=UPI0007C9CF51|nr:hypothetical protein [Neisseria weaveri]SAY52072.1 Uncharacterised protein [Neisseria weaveri]
MKQNLEKLEACVLKLVEKMQTLLNENRRLQEEITHLKLEHEQQKQEHQAAVDELSDALLVQVGKLKNDLQDKIDDLLLENSRYRQILAKYPEYGQDNREAASEKQEKVEQ